MASEEDIQRNAMAVLGTAIKATPAAQKVDANQFCFQLSGAQWGMVPQGAELDTQAVFSGLTGKGVLPSDAAVVVLLLQRREERIGVHVKLPSQVELMTAQQRSDLLAAVPKMGSTGLTVVPAGTRPPMPAMGQKAPTVSARLAPVAAPPPPKDVVPATTVPREGSFLKRIGVSPGTLVLCVVLLGLGMSVRVALRDKVPEPAKVALPPAIAHLKVFKTDDGLFYFYDPVKDFEQSREQLDALARQAAGVAQANGGGRAYFCLQQEPVNCRAVKAIIRGERVYYMLKKPPEPGAPPPPAPAPDPTP